MAFTMEKGTRTMKYLLVATALALSINAADARPKHHRVISTVADPGCNILWPCIGVEPSAKGLRIESAMPFGKAQQKYSRRDSIISARSVARNLAYKVSNSVHEILPHPAGCPRRAFCGCGAMKYLGLNDRSLWLAREWFRFPRAAPGPRMAAVRRHHVFIIESYLGDNMAIAYNANSGRGLTRRHTVSLAGYTIVNPLGGTRHASAM